MFSIRVKCFKIIKKCELVSRERVFVLVIERERVVSFSSLKKGGMRAGTVN